MTFNEEITIKARRHAKSAAREKFYSSNRKLSKVYRINSTNFYFREVCRMNVINFDCELLLNRFFYAVKKFS